MSTQNAPAIQTTGLGKRYGSRWALQDCSVSVPRGHVSALVGPNGAGKTNLLKILAGLSAPSTGEAAVLGRVPRQTGEFLDSIGYLAQDVPLYKRLSADDHLGLGAHLNRRWDAAGARARLAALRIPADRPVATLSGGQRAQVGLSLALAKRYTELFGARNRGDVEQAYGRGYCLQDLGMISSFGAASGYIAVMVLALYIQDQNTTVLYRHPQLIWLACPLLLFWISRVWMLTHRGEMYDDPVVFAMRDGTSLVVGALFGLVFWLAA